MSQDCLPKLPAENAIIRPLPKVISCPVINQFLRQTAEKLEKKIELVNFTQKAVRRDVVRSRPAPLPTVSNAGKGNYNIDIISYHI